MTWYLECNGKQFHDKLSAISENTASGSPIRFTTPASYLDHDFSQRPKQTLEQLCVKHATALRKKYQHINLFYSGGCDSHYILKIFTENNIKIDKIIMVKSGFKRADFEIDDYALPFVRHLGIDYEVREPGIEYYQKYYLDTPQDKRTQHEHWHHFRLNNHFENVSDTPPGTVNIFGKEKPKLCYVNNAWYTYFLDVEVTAQPGQHNFYIEDPEIYSQQCHMLIKEIEYHKHEKEFNHITHYNQHQDFWNISIGRYNTSDHFPLKILQENGNFNNKDQEAVQSAEPRLVIAWKRRNGRLVKLYGDNWFNQGEPALGTLGVFSNFFCLTKKDVKTVDDLYPNGFKI